MSLLDVSLTEREEDKMSLLDVSLTETTEFFQSLELKNSKTDCTTGRNTVVSISFKQIHILQNIQSA